MRKLMITAILTISFVLPAWSQTASAPDPYYSLNCRDMLALTGSHLPGTVTKT